MLDSIRVRRQNQFLELSLDGSPLPVEISNRLESLMTVTRTYQVRGLEARMPDGSYQPFRTEKIPMYSYDGHGRYICGHGYWSRLNEEADRFGYGLRLEVVDPPHHRPERFDYNFARIFERMSLRYRQAELIACIVGNECGIVHAAGGIGKSFVTAAVALALPKARILLVTKRCDVAQRLVRGLTHYLPAVGLVGAGKRQWGRVTVCVADSLHRVPHDGEEPDIILCDEVHELAAPTYMAELMKFKRARMYGLTATHDCRNDGADGVLECIFGRVVFHMTVQEAVKNGLILPVKVEWLPVQMAYNPAEGLRDVPKERFGVWRNDVRNQLIAAKAREFHEDEQVLILVRTIEHAVYLKQCLPEFELNYDSLEKVEYDQYVLQGFLDPNNEPTMSTRRRNRQRDEFESGKLKKVISTLWDTGVDFTQLAVLIRADARASKIMDTQAPSRTVRRHDDTGKDHGLVVDCMDYFDPGLLRRSNERRRSYRENGWEESLEQQTSRNTVTDEKTKQNEYIPASGSVG